MRVSEMPAKELLKAIDFALENRWDESHQIVQQYEDDHLASWIHAVLHKIEGDLSNSRYWYRRAGKMEHLDDAPEQELHHIKSLLA